MKRDWAALGRVLFWLGWPLLYLYLRHTERTRVVVAHGDTVLVVKSWLGDGSWALPGGGLHRHELPLACAVREVREETGLSIKAGRLQELGPISLSIRGIPLSLHCFMTTLSHPTTPTPQRGEILEVAWLPLQDLLGKERISADTRQILTRYWAQRL